MKLDQVTDIEWDNKIVKLGYFFEVNIYEVNIYSRYLSYYKKVVRAKSYLTSEIFHSSRC